MKCRNCQGTLPENAHFCTECGAKVEKMPPLPAFSSSEISPADAPSPPKGYLYDPESGLYYSSQSTFNEGGQPVQRVTYYHPGYQQYQTVDYPASGRPVDSGKSGKRILAIVLAVLIFFGTITSVLVYQGARTQNQELTDDFEEETPAEEPSGFAGREGVPLEDLTPIDSGLGSYQEADFFQDSGFASSVQRVHNQIYFVSAIDNRALEEQLDQGALEKGTDPAMDIFQPTMSGVQVPAQTLLDEVPSTLEEETEETPPLPEQTEPEDSPEEDVPLEEDEIQEAAQRGYRPNQLYRLSSDGTQADLIVEVAEGRTLWDFRVIGDYLFYVVAPYEYHLQNPFVDMVYYYVPLDGSQEPEVFASGDGQGMVDYQGYLFIFGSSVEEEGPHLLQVGLDPNGEVGFYPHSLNLPQSMDFYISQLCIIEGKILLSGYDYANDYQSTGYYLMSSQQYIEVFRGDPGYFYRNIFLDENIIYFNRVRFVGDGRYPMELGYIQSGSEGAPTIFAVKENQNWLESGPFIHRVNQDIYYETQGQLVKASLDNVEESTPVIQMDSRVLGVNYPHLFFADGRYYHFEREEYQDTKVSDHAPLVEQAGADLPDASLHPDQLLPEGEYDAIFRFENMEDVAWGLGYMIQELDMEETHFMDDDDFIAATGVLLQSGVLQEYFFDNTGRLDQEFFLAFVESLFGISPEAYLEQIKDGEVLGLSYLDGQLVLDYQYHPPKKVIRVQLSSTEDVDIRELVVTYDNGSTQRVGVATQDQYGDVSEYILIGLVDEFFLDAMGIV